MAKEFELSSTDSIPIDINFQRIIAQITRERNQSLRTKPHSSLKRYYCNRFWTKVSDINIGLDVGDVYSLFRFKHSNSVMGKDRNVNAF